MRNKSPWRAVACTSVLFGALLHGATAGSDLQRTLDRMLDQAALQAGVRREALVPDLQDHAVSATRDRRSPLLQAALKTPDRLPRMAGDIERKFRDAATSPARVMARTAELAGVVPGTTRTTSSEGDEASRLLCAGDPLWAGLNLLRGDAAPRSQARTDVNDVAEVRATWRLRLEISRVLAAIAYAERQRRKALDSVAPWTTPDALLQQAIALAPAAAAILPTGDYRQLLPLVERAPLRAGMQRLAEAVERFDRYLAASDGGLPVVDWRWPTPMGWVVVDTTGRSSTHTLRDPLLVIDVGGDDTYFFAERSPDNRIAVVLDRGGNDRYVAQVPGADPSAGVMGYGILWDSAGDDRYEGAALSQGAALFGEALHFDGGGNDVYEATSFSQGYALGGAALLLSRGGDDRFTAWTHAQGSAGPEGSAVLMDTSGNDRYVLGNEHLVLPSAQLPDRNVSMGQGAGRGERARAGDGLSATGGVGLLLDLEGDDHYMAQVFAQGAGYYEGVGLLIDGGGQDRFEAAWYAMAAAAHQAVGALVHRGQASNVYRASHSTSIGAAHDFSVAVFLEEGGDDVYDLGNLGLGAAHDNSVAIFFDAGGNDRYTVRHPRCQAFGTVVQSDRSVGRGHAPGVGLFLEPAARGKQVANRRARISASCPQN